MKEVSHKTYHNFKQKLQTAYTERESDSLTRIVFEEITGNKKMADSAISSNQQKELDKVLSGLLQHKPLQYILGKADFYGLKFYVDPNVLIPRPETEELVYQIIEDHPPDKELSIIDIGTGSGCIAITLKKYLSKGNIYAIDNSVKALDLAKQNAAMHKTDIRFLHTNFLNKDSWINFPELDLIVSNPPYVLESEKQLLDRNIQFEPPAALFVPHEDPLLFYDAIARFADEKLKREGSVYVECHEDYANTISENWKAHFKIIDVRKDLQGKERIIRGKKTS